ncbi:MAG: GNAT family N-acetyltransferase, partial [Dehalococcoidia bacterium]
MLQSCSKCQPRLSLGNLTSPSRQEASITIQVRNFHWSELEDFFELAKRVHGPDAWLVSATSERVREKLAQPNLHPEEDLFIAYQGPKAVGYVEAVFELPLKRVVMEGGVDPQHLNQGIGTRLLESAIELAQKRSYKVLHVPSP